MKKCYIVLTAILLLLCIAACGKAKGDEIKHIQINNEEDGTVVLASDASFSPIDVIFMNVSNVDIGMISIIDPLSHEQINVSSLVSGEVVSIGINWPKDEKLFYWALYNTNGELCIDGNSDLTGIKESATIIISGEGDETEIEVQLD